MSVLFPNLRELVDTAESVDRLRELVLDFAVRGRLVSQEPDDEPASKLLERIANEKALLSSQSSATVDSSDSDLPFTLPNGWVVQKLTDVALRAMQASITRREP